jgi:hypothetical protein
MDASEEVLDDGIVKRTLATLDDDCLDINFVQDGYVYQAANEDTIIRYKDWSSMLPTLQEAALAKIRETFPDLEAVGPVEFARKLLGLEHDHFEIEDHSFFIAHEMDEVDADAIVLTLSYRSYPCTMLALRVCKIYDA